MMWIGIVLMPIWIQNQILFDADPDQDLDITVPKDMAKLIIDKSKCTKYRKIFSI